MCKCGCNTCETKSTLMLNESLAPRAILSEGLKYHIDNNKPLTEHLYRAGSRAYFDLISEARSLYSRGILEFTNEDDLAILTETDLGHFGMFEGKKVPLDFPIELNEQMDIYDDIANSEFGMDYDQLGSNEKEWVRDEIDNMEMRESLNESNSNYPDFDLNKNIRYQDTSISSGMWRYTGQEQGGKGVYRNLNNGQILAFDRSDFDIFRNHLSSHFDISESLNEVEKDINQLKNLSNRKERYNYIKNFSKEKLIDIADELYLDYEEYDDIENKVLNSFGESLSESFSQKDWDVKWKMPKDNLFNATKTTDAVNNRYKAIRSLLKSKPTELKAFDNTDDHPAYDMSYDELMKWFKTLKEPVKEAKMPTQDQVDKFFALTQNEIHYLNSKPVMGQEKTFNKMEVEPWDEYDLSNFNSLVRKAKSKGKINENKAIITFKNDYEVKMNHIAGYDDDFEHFEAGERESVYILDKNAPFQRVHVEFGDGTNAFIPKDVISVQESQLGEATVNYDFSKKELIRVIKQLKNGASTEVGMIKAFETALGRELSDDEIRGFKIDPSKVGRASLEERINTILEAKKKAKKNTKKLNKPMRDSSGGKAYKVYVKDPKTKKIKTVRFGSGGLRAKINDKKARNAFAKRHKCSTKKDKTKAGYWSCRLPRYAKLLGLKSNFGGFW